MAPVPSLDATMLTFNVGDRLLRLPTSVVREIIPMPRIARVPRAPAALLGVANVRGTVIPVTSVARLMGRDQDVSSRVIVMDIDGLVGLAVTSVSQVVDATDARSVDLLEVGELIARAAPVRDRASGRRGMTATNARADNEDAIALLAFTAGGQSFALPLSAIDEALHVPDDIARIPHADAVVVGSLNHRDAILPLLSLAALLALPVGPVTQKSRIVVVRIGSHRVGMVVDGVQAVVTVRAADVDPVPEVLNRSGAEARIQAICRMAGGTELLSILAPDQLLRDDITARLASGSSGAALDATADEVEPSGDRFLIFTIGDECFGLPVSAVDEVASLPDRPSRMPLMPPFVCGVINVRGAIIPLIDQAGRFACKADPAANPRVIVLRVGDLRAGIVVDGVSDVVRILDDAVRPAPGFDVAASREFDRVASIAGRETPVLIVDPRELLAGVERDILDQFAKNCAPAS